MCTNIKWKCNTVKRSAHLLFNFYFLFRNLQNCGRFVHGVLLGEDFSQGQKIPLQNWISILMHLCIPSSSPISPSVHALCFPFLLHVFVSSLLSKTFWLPLFVCLFVFFTFYKLLFTMRVNMNIASPPVNHCGGWLFEIDWTAHTASPLSCLQGVPGSERERETGHVRRDRRRDLSYSSSKLVIHLTDVWRTCQLFGLHEWIVRAEDGLFSCFILIMSCKISGQ